ncbi:hypothetical protein OIO90_000650 [Microbotryomycetes sp. JL221]|nr:hypothetical protein OIO90_000650 [Microbotryomycetes sp. JL221]
MAPSIPKSPSTATGLRRSSRASTPTQRATSPRLSVSASTPSLASLAAPPPSYSTATRRSPRQTLSPAPSYAPVPRTRPTLPTKDANKFMPEWKGRMHKVKTQTLHLNDSDDTIKIARVKVPVPKGVPGHIIKRFDTGAVSASSLFRAAFPTASQDDEATEMAWIREGSNKKYGDTRQAGHEDDATQKLSGVWVSIKHAPALAKEYGILRFAQDLIDYTEEDGHPATEASGFGDSENDSPAAIKSPRAKRARVTSPPAAAVTSPTPRSQALSGASANGVSIMQTLATDTDTGIVTETTQVKVDVPVLEADSNAVSNGLVASDELVAEQIEQAKQLVETLKQDGTLTQLTQATNIVGGTKRALERDDDEADEDEGDDKRQFVDRRGFFGKIFRRGPSTTTTTTRRASGRRGQAPITAGRQIKPVPQTQDEQTAQELLVYEADQEQVEGRRWVAGFGLALAVGATAAAPFFFG